MLGRLAGSVEGAAESSVLLGKAALDDVALLASGSLGGSLSKPLSFGGSLSKPFSFGGSFRRPFSLGGSLSEVVAFWLEKTPSMPGCLACDCLAALDFAAALAAAFLPAVLLLYSSIKA